MSSPKIIKNQSKGYGYTYNNLADLARAGVEIPPMKTAIVEGREYVFAKLGDEWIQGAQVIDIDMKGMNAAQAYGSATTNSKHTRPTIARTPAANQPRPTKRATLTSRHSATSAQSSTT